MSIYNTSDLKSEQNDMLKEYITALLKVVEDIEDKTEKNSQIEEFKKCAKQYALALYQGVNVEQIVGYKSDKMEQLRLAAQDGIDIEQIKEFDTNKIFEIRYGFALGGQDNRDILSYINSSYDELVLINDAYNEGMTNEQVAEIFAQGYPFEVEKQMLESISEISESVVQEENSQESVEEVITKKEVEKIEEVSEKSNTEEIVEEQPETNIEDEVLSSDNNMYVPEEKESREEFNEQNDDFTFDNGLSDIFDISF